MFFRSKLTYQSTLFKGLKGDVKREENGMCMGFKGDTKRDFKGDVKERDVQGNVEGDVVVDVRGM